MLKDIHVIISLCQSRVYFKVNLKSLFFKLNMVVIKNVLVLRLVFVYYTKKQGVGNQPKNRTFKMFVNIYVEVFKFQRFNLHNVTAIVYNRTVNRTCYSIIKDIDD